MVRAMGGRLSREKMHAQCCKALGFVPPSVPGKLVAEARSHHSMVGRGFLRGGYSRTRMRAEYSFCSRLLPCTNLETYEYGLCLSLAGSVLEVWVHGVLWGELHDCERKNEILPLC